MFFRAKREFITLPPPLSNPASVVCHFGFEFLSYRPCRFWQPNSPLASGTKEKFTSSPTLCQVQKPLFSLRFLNLCAISQITPPSTKRECITPPSPCQIHFPTFLLYNFHNHSRPFFIHMILCASSCKFPWPVNTFPLLDPSLPCVFTEANPTCDTPFSTTSFAMTSFAMTSFAMIVAVKPLLQLNPRIQPSVEDVHEQIS